MQVLTPLKWFAVFLGTLGMVLPAPVLAAGPVSQPTQVARDQVPNADALPVRVADVTLDARGSLLGLVLSVEGVPVSGARVTLRRGDVEVAQAVTDGLGRFVIEGVRGGTHQLTTGRYATLVRAWSPGTAPPHAKSLALLLVGGDVVRGQVPAGQLFCSDAFMFAVLAGALVAVPIAVHATNEKGPASP
jgi:hypothetical protein